ncbi:MAG: hypothetical protein M1821_003315 [Bathelium mastoideum]|nr:MAG: hypothetical protein M1821_003315 [Bathelium mastoideum]
MVGVINPNSSQVLATQKALAKSSDYMLEPGQPFPQEAASSISSIAATATATVTAAFTEGTQGSEPMTMTNSHSGLSGGAIAGIVVGVLAVLLLAAALFFYLGRAKSLKQALAYSTTKANNNNARSSQPPPSARDMTYSPEPAFPSPFPYKADTPAYHRHTPSSYDVPPYSITAPKSPEATVVDLDSVAGGGSPRLSSRSFGPGPRYTPTATDMGGFYPSSHGDPISLADAMSRSRTSSPSGALFAEVGLTAAGSQRSSPLGPHEMDAS